MTMKGFTFSQLAVIILIMIGLVFTIIIAVTYIQKYGAGTGSIMGNTGGNAQGVENLLGSCESLGGTCIIGGCGGRVKLGEDLCGTGEECCV